MKLALVTQIRNEGPRLKDWIKYHSKVIGFDLFVIYLDNCNDDSEEILKSLQNEFSIEIKQVPVVGEYPEGRGLSQTANWTDFNKGLDVPNSTWPGERMVRSYTEAFDNLKQDFDWIAIFDVDEWIVPQDIHNFDFKKELSKLETNLLYLQTYDFRPPYDYQKRVIEQNMHRWDLEEKMSVEMRGTGKSVFRGKMCLDIKPRVGLHWGPEGVSEYTNSVECGPIYLNNGITGYKKYLLYEFRSHTENCKRPLTDDQYQLYDDSLVRLFEKFELI